MELSPMRVYEAQAEVYQRQAEIFKALAHPTRVMIVSTIAKEGPKCVCQLVEKSGFDQSTISKHLALLKSGGILRSVKEGLNVRYEINMPCVVQLLDCTECVCGSDKGRHSGAKAESVDGCQCGHGCERGNREA